jgi:RNA polymerase primary sigma factor
VTSQDLLQGLGVEDPSTEQVEGSLTNVRGYLRREASEGAGEEPRAIRPGGDDLPAPDPVRMYLKEVGRVPLLTAAQEVDLAMRMEAGGFAAELLASIDCSNMVDLKRLRVVVHSVLGIREHQLDPKNKLLSGGIGLERVTRAYLPRARQEALQFLRRVENDGRIARKRLIEANLRLVVSIAKRYTSHGMTFLDLAQEGNLGLIRAVEKFDYTRGYKFSTYATWWIRQAITRAIADQSRIIRIPVHMTELINKLARTERDLTQDLGREPLAEEIGRHLGMSADRVRAILEISREPLSLEAPQGGETEDAHLGDLIADDDSVTPQEAASFIMLKEQLESVLHTLSSRERKIIQLRFGLLDGHPRTLDEVGREFHLTRERIRQIAGETLSKLRHASRAQKLRDYLD